MLILFTHIYIRFSNTYMSIILHIYYFSILTHFNHYSKSSKDLPGLSSLTSEYVWSPSTDSDSPVSFGLSNVLLLLLPWCLCQCLCSAMLMTLIFGFGFPNLTHVQLANSFLDLQGGGCCWICLSSIDRCHY